MATKFYLPRTDAQKVLWLNNFAAKLPQEAAILDLKQEEVASVVNDSLVFSYVIDCLESVKKYNLQMTSFKDLMRDDAANQVVAFIPSPPNFQQMPANARTGIFNRIRKLVQSIKVSKNYTENIGKNLGIIGESQIIDYSNLKPSLRVGINANNVVIKWRRGYTDALNVYVKRGDADFVLVGTSIKSPFVDVTKLPDSPTNWVYRAIFVVKDKEVGKYSDEENILVKKFV